MTEPFGHEKLIVYQKGMRFAVFRGALLERMPRRVAACDHLDRGAESILLNIAEGNGRFSGQNQAAFYETAYKATIQSASLVDLATANGVADVARAGGSPQDVGATHTKPGRTFLSSGFLRRCAPTSFTRDARSRGSGRQNENCCGSRKTD